MALELIRSVVRDMVADYAKLGLTLTQHDRALIRAVAASILEDCCGVDIRKVQSVKQDKTQHVETGNPRRISATMEDSRGQITYFMGGIVASNNDSRQPATKARLDELRAQYARMESLGVSPFDMSEVPSILAKFGR